MREQSIAKYIALGYDESHHFMRGWIHGYEDQDTDDGLYENGGDEYLAYWRGYNQGCRDY